MTLKIGLAQMAFRVGNTKHNTAAVLAYAERAMAAHCDLLVFPEQTLTGYPADDLWLRQQIIDECEHALQELCNANLPIALVITYPEQTAKGTYNAAVVIHQGQRIAHYRKQYLPNYTVFDDKRYFIPGNEVCVFSLKDYQIGLVICEDLWGKKPVAQAKKAGAEFIIAPNASPFEIDKQKRRVKLLTGLAKHHQIPICYLNWADAQDDMISDGNSMIIDKCGQICAHAAPFTEQLLMATFNENNIISHQDMPKTMTELATIYQALTFSLRIYLEKNGARGALLGLSGGIDSALVLALAVDAIGADNVEVLILPSRYTSQMSIEDASLMVKQLGVTYNIINIEPLHQTFLNIFAERKMTPQDLTDQNAQARLRGLLLMAESNQNGKLVLNTSNKSELAMGYSTLYGDAIGAFALLKDVYKTKVYELARYRNTISPVIPESILTRAPSAELKPDQTDQDHLPPYEILDAILQRHIEQNLSATDIIQAGFSAETVTWVLKRLYQNEYKRRQSPIGPHLTHCSFNRDRRYPISTEMDGGF